MRSVDRVRFEVSVFDGLAGPLFLVEQEQTHRSPWEGPVVAAGSYEACRAAAELLRGDGR